MLATVSLSEHCSQTPACWFCYEKKKDRLVQQVMDRLSGDRTFDGNFSLYTGFYNGSQARLQNVDTVCWEYSGYNLREIPDLSFYKEDGNNAYQFKTFTMTTMPSAVTSPIFAKFCADKGISAIALSYDSEKVSNIGGIHEWIQKARWIKDAGIKVGCNFLIEDAYHINLDPDVIKECDQLNVLTLKVPRKQNGKLRAPALEKVRIQIEMWKSQVPVAIDNCLGIQLGYQKECGRGKDFVHVTARGEIQDCCFEGACAFYQT